MKTISMSAFPVLSAMSGTGWALGTVHVELKNPAASSIIPEQSSHGVLPS